MTLRKSEKAKKRETREPDTSEEFTGGSAPLRKIPTLFDNLYEIVVAAATRARQINAGSPSPLRGNDDRPLNVALREIAAGKTKYEVVREEPEE